MNNQKKSVAIIPARKGSKGLPKKNVRLMDGKPLICYAIEAATQAASFGQIIVSTNCEEVIDICQTYDEVTIIERPDELCTDNSGSLGLIKHAIEDQDLEPDSSITLLQPTSPLRTASQIKSAVKLFNGSTIVSVKKVDNHILKGYLAYTSNVVAIEHGRFFETPRQELPALYTHNGAIYVFSTAFLKNCSALFDGNERLFLMDDISSVDIDTEYDFQFAENVIQGRRNGVD